MKLKIKSKMVKSIVAIAALTMSYGVMAKTPDVMVAPYVDGTLTQSVRLAEVYKETGISRFNIGFIVANSQNKASWGGQYELLKSPIDSQIELLRKQGGDIILSVGGAAGTPLHIAIKDEAELTKELIRIVDTYDLEAIDFDIEGTGLTDLDAARRLVRSIAALQDAFKNLEIWMTLPVAKDGLTSEGKAVVDYAVKKEVDLKGINLMVMNYGYEAKPSDMSDQAIVASSAVVSQLDEIYKAYGQKLTSDELWEMIGLTPMIGVNNTGQIFTLDDAKELMAFAKQKDIGYIGYWSLSRDRQGSLGVVSPVHSGVMQEPLAYTKIFAGVAEEVIANEIKVLPIGTND
ncbi:MAG: chitinase, partial [Cellulosilyticaceae bacterium]